MITKEKLEDTRWVRLTESCEGCEYRDKGFDVEINDYNSEVIREENRINPHPLYVLIEEHGAGRYTHCKLTDCIKESQ